MNKVGRHPTRGGVAAGALSREMSIRAQVRMARGAVKIGDRNVGEICLAPIAISMASRTLNAIMVIRLDVEMADIAAGIIRPSMIDISCIPRIKTMAVRAIGLKMGVWFLRLVANAAFIAKIVALDAPFRIMPGYIRNARNLLLVYPLWEIDVSQQL